MHIEEAIAELEKKHLCESWPIDGRKLEAQTGKWKSNMVDRTSLSVDGTRVTLRFDLLQPVSTWNGPAQRSLTVFLADFGFVVDELYADRLNQAVHDFLDSPLVRSEVNVVAERPS